LWRGYPGAGAYFLREGGVPARGRADDAVDLDAISVVDTCSTPADGLATPG
jgi:hypothetical protein